VPIPTTEGRVSDKLFFKEFMPMPINSKRSRKTSAVTFSDNVDPIILPLKNGGHVTRQ